MIWTCAEFMSVATAVYSDGTLCGLPSATTYNVIMKYYVWCTFIFFSILPVSRLVLYL